MPSTNTKSRRPRPMNVHVHRGSVAERKYRAVAGVPGLLPEELYRHDLMLTRQGSCIESASRLADVVV